MSNSEKNVKSETAVSTAGQKAKRQFVRWAIGGGVILLAFLVGLIPMWMSARTCADEHEKTRKQLRKVEVRNLLVTSLVEARRGEYETARQTASEFFTRLRAEEEKGDGGFLNADQRAKLSPIFEHRDAVITMLAQRDQASHDRLNDIYSILLDVLPANDSTPAGTPPAPM